MYDFAHPQISKVTADLKGVAILLWGANGTGKTPIACQFEKPYYLAFEGGITGMDGIPYAPMKSWKDFAMFTKWATNPATTEEAHATTQTIILDTVDVMADYCIDYTCSKLGIQSLGETRLTADGKKDGSVNAYTEYGREFKRTTRALRNAGFTLVYIAHDGGYRDDVDPVTHQRYTKMYPSGDRRAIEPICNDVDVIGYLQAAPVDENGHPVFSTIYFAPNNQFHTRSRYTEIVPYIQKVTAKSLCDAIVEAKRKEAEKTGAKLVTFEDQQAAFRPDKQMTFPELRDAIKEIALKLHEANRMDEFNKVIAEDWGAGRKVSEIDEKEGDKYIEVLSLVLADLQSIKL